ncbi:unnamed protein product [Urochloa humidicola]
MMSGSKKERNLSTCSQLSQKSSAHFCLFSKVRSASPPPGNTAVYLNVYDLTPVNGYVYWAGLGIFHSGIEGAVCNCILPESLKINAVCHDPDGQAEDSEKRRLTGAFSCFSSISLCQRHFSTSSLSLRSPAKGTSWDTKQSSSARLKKS